MLKKLFGFDIKKSSIKTELLSGLTTFITMAYILAVNPLILSSTGMDFGALFTATALSAAIATILMGIYAKLPLAQAPGMGLNAFFAYTLVGAMGYSWQTALTVTFIEGVIFILLTAFGIREKIVEAIPKTLNHAIAVGIGFLIAFIGLKNGEIIVANQATFVALGEFTPNSIIAFGGILLCAVLCHRKIKGALLISIIICTLAALACGLISTPENFKIISKPQSLSPTFLKFDFKSLLNFDIILLTVMLVFMDIFNTLGTFVGVASQTGMADKDGTIKNMKQGLMCDAWGTTIGAVLGTSTITTYVESASGIAEGGRSGLTAVSTGFLFLISLFFFPIFALIPSYATTGALVMVGIMMSLSIKKIDFSNYSVGTSAFLTIISMLLTYSIPEGIAIGLLSYVIINIFTSERKKITLIQYILASLLLLRYLFYM